MRTALTFVSLLAVVFVLAPQERLDAQVTTATFVGLVHDSSGAVVPGATVVATHRGTGVPREASPTRAVSSSSRRCRKAPIQ